MFRFKTNLQILYRFAAILFMGLLIGGLIVNYALNQEPFYVNYIAPKGSVSQMILADRLLVVYKTPRYRPLYFVVSYSISGNLKNAIPSRTSGVFQKQKTYSTRYHRAPAEEGYVNPLVFNHG